MCVHVVMHSCMCVCIHWFVFVLMHACAAPAHIKQRSPDAALEVVSADLARELGEVGGLVKAAHHLVHRLEYVGAVHAQRRTPRDLRHLLTAE